MSNNKSRNQKARKRGRNGGDSFQKNLNETQLKDEDQEYAIAVSANGHTWKIKVLIDEKLVDTDGKPRKSRTLKRFNPGDYLLVSRRVGMSNNKIYDILYKYSEDEVKYLRSLKELPETKDMMMSNQESKINTLNKVEDCGFDFEDI